MFLHLKIFRLKTNKLIIEWKGSQKAVALYIRIEYIFDDFMKIKINWNLVLIQN